MVERGETRLESAEELAKKVFHIILHQVVANTVDIEEVKTFREKINPETGLANFVLMARAYEDLKDPNGKIVLTYRDVGPEEIFALPGEFILKLSTKDGERVFEKPVVGILLNPGSQACRKQEGGHFILSKDDFYSVAEALVWVQAHIEQAKTNGTYDSLMSRREFREALSS